MFDDDNSRSNGDFNYSQFLSSSPTPQAVIDFISYFNDLPVKTLEDVETCVSACLLVKEKSETIKYRGYYYNSQFIVYEQLFYTVQHEEYGKTRDSFEKAVSFGLESLRLLPSENAMTMGLRTEILLRYPEKSGFPSEFVDTTRAEEIKVDRVKDRYFSKASKSECFRSFCEADDLKQALFYAEQNSREQMYCKLHLGDVSALQYFESLWKSKLDEDASKVDVSVGVSYLQALEMHCPEKALKFQEELEEKCKRFGNAESFTHWARMDLKVYSNDHGFTVMAWVSAGISEPTLKDCQNSLSHCDMGLQNIAAVRNGGPYEYRNRVFCHETKGWVYANKMPKTLENFRNALLCYKSALQLYVQVDNYERDLQYATGRHSHILKEVLSLIVVPANHGFGEDFNSDASVLEIIQSYKEMAAAENSNFPYIKQLKQAFEYQGTIAHIKNLHNKILESKKEELVDLMVSTPAGKGELIASEIQNFEQSTLQLDKIFNDPELNAYYEGFMYTISSVHLVSVAIEQQVFTLVQKNETEVSIASSLISLIPLVGSQLATGFEFIAAMIDEEFTLARARNVVKLAPTPARLDMLAQDLAIKLITHKEKVIKELEASMQAAGSEHIPWYTKLSQMIEEAKGVVFGDTKVFDSVEAELGNRDATILINNMVANGEIARIKKATPAIRVEKLYEYICSHPEDFNISTGGLQMFEKVSTDGATVVISKAENDKGYKAKPAKKSFFKNLFHRG